VIRERGFDGRQIARRGGVAEGEIERQHLRRLPEPRVVLL
jgi:hypothetical protein